jgi:hypothetical protein
MHVVWLGNYKGRSPFNTHRHEEDIIQTEFREIGCEDMNLIKLVQAPVSHNTELWILYIYKRGTLLPFQYLHTTVGVINCQQKWQPTFPYRPANKTENGKLHSKQENHTS